MSGTWDNVETQALLRAVLALRNVREAKKFFRDLLTEAELCEFGRRWYAARLLGGGAPYTRVQEVTGLSSTTIARVAKWLTSGMGGYQLLLNRLHAHHHPRESPRGKRLR